jgi:hypothetical protein
VHPSEAFAPGLVRARCAYTLVVVALGSQVELGRSARTARGEGVPAAVPGHQAERLWRPTNVRSPQLAWEAVAAHDLEQEEMDAWWTQLLANEPGTVR